MPEGTTVEDFELRKKGCLVVLTARQEWARGASDVEVVFDEELRPLRAWKRMTVPSSTRADGHADTRRYEMRVVPPTMKHRSSEGEITFDAIRGGRPEAVIGPGRGVLTAWIRRANLQVGEKVRVPVLDFREMLEVVRDVTLRREEDRVEPATSAFPGRRLRVYTVYGREAVFTDENNVVVGDLAGLRPSNASMGPEPPPAPTFQPPDPAHTP